MRRSIVSRWLLVALALVVVDLFVRGPFFDRYMAPLYVDIGLMPRDRTNGHAWNAIFDGAARLPRPMLRVGIVGDSTVNGTDGMGDDTVPAWFLREALRRRLPDVTVDVIDVSEIGLYTNDAVFLLNKMLTKDYDILIYGFTLRSLPSLPNSRWATHLTSELTPAEVSRLGTVGGQEWFWTGVTGSEVLESMVQSVWATYAYRAFLKRCAWEKVTSRVLAPWPSLVAATKPLPFSPPKIGVPKQLLPGKTEWTREGYAIPNSNWDALEVMGGLCARYAPGRCLFYSGPINPLGRDRLAEPGHYEEYLARVRVLMGRAGVRFRDFTDALDASGFRKPMFPRPGDDPPRDPIHMNQKGAAVLTEYIADTVVDMAQPILARARRK